MKKLAVLLLSLFVLSGCANQSVWVNPSKNDAEAQKDFRECKYDSGKSSFVPYSNVTSPISAGIQEGFQSANLLSECMRSRGYNLVNRQSFEENKNANKQTYNNIDEAFKNKDYSRVIEITDRHLYSNPNDIEVYVARGHAYTWLGKYNEAITDYNKASTLGSKNLKLVVGKATCFAQIGEYDVALEAVNQALVLQQDASLYNIRAYVYYKKGEFDKALEDCNKSIALDNNKPNVYKNRGLALYGKMQYEKAIEQFNKSISIELAYAKAYDGRGDTYLKLGKNENAMLDFRKACEFGEKESCAKVK